MYDMMHDNRVAWLIRKWFKKKLKSGPVVFLHIPKCGGTSLTNSIVGASAAKSVLHGHDKVLFGSFDDFNSIGEPYNRVIFPGSLPNENYDFVTGHFSLSKLKANFPQGNFVTLLREPRIRILSHFLFWRSLSEVELKRWGNYADYIRLSHGKLNEFLQNKKLSGQIDNLITRVLLYPHKDIPLNDTISPHRYDELFQQAKAKLDSLQFVDILENVNLEENLSRWLGKSLTLKKDNETPAISNRSVSFSEMIDLHTEHLLKRLTSIDSKLFEHIVKKANVGDKVNALELYRNYVSRQAAWSGL